MMASAERLRDAFLALGGGKEQLPFADASRLLIEILRVPVDQVRQVFDHMDIDGDGHLSLHEFLLHAPSMLASPPGSPPGSPDVKPRRSHHLRPLTSSSTGDLPSGFSLPPGLPLQQEPEHLPIRASATSDKIMRPSSKQAMSLPPQGVGFGTPGASQSAPDVFDTPTRKRAEERFERLLTQQTLHLRSKRSIMSDRASMRGSMIKREDALLAVGSSPALLQKQQWQDEDSEAARAAAAQGSPSVPHLPLGKLLAQGKALSPDRPISLGAAAQRRATLTVTPGRPASLGGSPVSPARRLADQLSPRSSSPSVVRAADGSLSPPSSPTASTSGRPIMRRQRSRSSFSFTSRLYEIQSSSVESVSSPRDTIVIDFQVFSHVNPLAPVGVLHARVSQNIIVQELCQHLIMLTSYGNEDFGLFLQPSGSKELLARFRQSFGEWLTPSQAIGLYTLGNASCLEFRSTVRPLTIRLADSSEVTATINESLPVSDALKSFAATLQLVDAFEYGLKTPNMTATQWVDANTNFAGNSISLSDTQLTLHKRFFFDDFRRDQNQPGDLRLTVLKLMELVHRGHFELADEEIVQLAVLSALINFGNFEAFTHLRPDKADRLRPHIRDTLLPSYVRARRRKRDLDKMEAAIVSGWVKKKLTAIEAQNLYLCHLRSNDLFGVSVYRVLSLPSDALPVIRAAPTRGNRSLRSPRQVPGSRPVRLHLSKTAMELRSEDNSTVILKRTLREIFRYACANSRFGPVLQLEIDEAKTLVLLTENAPEILAELTGYIKCWLDTMQKYEQPTNPDALLRSPPTSPPASPRAETVPARYLPIPLDLDPTTSTAAAVQQHVDKDDNEEQEHASIAELDIEAVPRKLSRSNRSLMMSSRSKQIKLMLAMDVFDINAISASLSSVLAILETASQHYSDPEMRSFSEPLSLFIVSGLSDVTSPAAVLFLRITTELLPGLLELLDPAQFTHISTVRQPTVVILRSLFALAHAIEELGAAVGFLACCALALAQVFQSAVALADQLSTTSQAEHRRSTSLSGEVDAAQQASQLRNFAAQHQLLHSMLTTVRLMVAVVNVPRTDRPTRALLQQITQLFGDAISQLVSSLTSSSSSSSSAPSSPASDYVALLQSCRVAIGHAARHQQILLADAQTGKHIAGLIAFFHQQVLTPISQLEPSIDLRELRNVAASLLLVTRIADAPIVPSELMLALRELMTNNDISQPGDFARSFALLFRSDPPLFPESATAMDIWFDFRSLLFLVELRRQFKSTIELLIRLCSLVDLARHRQRRENLFGPAFLDPVDSFLGLSASALAQCRAGLQLLGTSASTPLDAEATARLFRSARHMCVSATAVFQSALLLDLNTVVVAAFAADTNALSQRKLTLRSIASAAGPAAIDRLFLAIESYEDYRRCATISRLLEQLDSITGAKEPLLLLSSSTTAALQLFPDQQEFKTPLQLCRKLVEQDKAIGDLVSAPFAIERLTESANLAVIFFQKFVFLALVTARTISESLQYDTPVDHTQHAQEAAKSLSSVVVFLQVNAILVKSAAQSGLSVAAATKLATLLRTLDLLAVRSLCISLGNQLDKLYDAAKKLSHLSFQQFYSSASSSTSLAGDDNEDGDDPEAVWKHIPPLFESLLRATTAATLLPTTKLLLAKILKFVSALAKQCQSSDSRTVTQVQQGVDNLFAHSARLLEDVFLHRGLQLAGQVELAITSVTAALSLGGYLFQLVRNVSELLVRIQALHDLTVSQLSALEQERGDLLLQSALAPSKSFEAEHCLGYCAIVSACIGFEDALLRFIERQTATGLLTPSRAEQSPDVQALASSPNQGGLDEVLLPALAKIAEQALSFAKQADAVPPLEFSSFFTALTTALQSAIRNRSMTELHASSEISSRFRYCLAEYFPGIGELKTAMVRIDTSFGEPEDQAAPPTTLDVESLNLTLGKVKTALVFSQLAGSDGRPVPVEIEGQRLEIRKLSSSILTELLALAPVVQSPDDLSTFITRMFESLHGCWLSAARSFFVPHSEVQQFQQAVDDLIRHLARESLVSSQVAAPNLALDVLRECIARLTTAANEGPQTTAPSVPYLDLLFQLEKALLGLSESLRRSQQVSARFLTGSAELLTSVVLAIFDGVFALPDVEHRRAELIASTKELLLAMAALFTQLCTAYDQNCDIGPVLLIIDDCTTQLKDFDPITKEINRFLSDFFSCDLLPAFFAAPTAGTHSLDELHALLVSAMKPPLHQLTRLSTVLWSNVEASPLEVGRHLADLHTVWQPLFNTVALYLNYEEFSVTVASQFHRLTLSVCRFLQAFDELIRNPDLRTAVLTSSSDQNDEQQQQLSDRQCALMRLGAALELQSSIATPFEKSRAVLLFLRDEAIAAIESLVLTSRALVSHSKSVDEALKTLCISVLTALQNHTQQLPGDHSEAGATDVDLRQHCQHAETMISQLNALAAASCDQPMVFQDCIEQLGTSLQAVLPLLSRIQQVETAASLNKATAATDLLRTLYAELKQLRHDPKAVPSRTQLALRSLLNSLAPPTQQKEPATLTKTQSRAMRKAFQGHLTACLHKIRSRLDGTPLRDQDQFDKATELCLIACSRFYAEAGRLSCFPEMFGDESNLTKINHEFEKLEQSITSSRRESVAGSFQTILSCFKAYLPQSETIPTIETVFIVQVPLILGDSKSE